MNENVTVTHILSREGNKARLETTVTVSTKAAKKAAMFDNVSCPFIEVTNRGIIVNDEKWFAHVKEDHVRSCMEYIANTVPHRMIYHG